MNSGASLRKKIRANGKSSSATPIEEGRGLGPVSTAALRAIDIETVEQLEREGWKGVLSRLVTQEPKRANVNMAYALIGAIYYLDWRCLPDELRIEARAFVAELLINRNTKA
jgi:hypothetical protein